jgi:hypothetical protein
MYYLLSPLIKFIIINVKASSISHSSAPIPFFRIRLEVILNVAIKADGG